MVILAGAVNSAVGARHRLRSSIVASSASVEVTRPWRTSSGLIVAPHRQGDVHGLENYILLLTKDTTFHSAVYNTLYFVAAYVPLNIAVALGVAVWLQGYGRADGY